MKRREFIKSISFAAIVINPITNFAMQKNDKINDDISNPQYAPVSEFTKNKLNDIFTKAKKHNWHLMAIGDIVARIGMELMNTPYVAGTLDIESYNEKVILNLAGLDCVTFFENSLCIARCVKTEQYSVNDLLHQIEFTRYQNGKLTDYASRLHYTADWIFNNVRKQTITDVTKNIGGIEHQFSFNYMSEHPNHYNALKGKDSTELINKIKDTEAFLNKQISYIIPTINIKKTNKFFEDGDIIAIATNKNGLDYGHTGLFFDNKFMNASSIEKKVVMNKTVYDYVKSGKNNIGISVLRPIIDI